MPSGWRRRAACSKRRANPSRSSRSTTSSTRLMSASGSGRLRRPSRSVALQAMGSPPRARAGVPRGFVSGRRLSRVLRPLTGTGAGGDQRPAVVEVLGEPFGSRRNRDGAPRRPRGSVLHGGDARLARHPTRARAWRRGTPGDPQASRGVPLVHARGTAPHRGHRLRMRVFGGMDGCVARTRRRLPGGRKGTGAAMESVPASESWETPCFASSRR